MGQDHSQVYRERDELEAKTKYQEERLKDMERTAKERLEEQKQRAQEYQRQAENIQKCAEENARLREEQEAKIKARVKEERQRIEKEAAKVRLAAIEERHNYPVPSHLSSFLGKINVCVTGPSGVGKSTLINAICGLDENSQGAAKTGVTETTLEPTPIQHPEFPQVFLWDCPGVGTQKFPQDTYVREMGLKHFACVLLVCATRFTENDHLLRTELERVKLPYFCIRSKFDQDRDSELKKLNKTRVSNLKIWELPHNQTRELFQKIKDDLRDNQRVSSPYIVSAMEDSVGDFANLRRDLRARLHQFAECRAPMLACSVCRRGENETLMVYCPTCANVLCKECAAVVPFCNECSLCRRPACYKSLGQKSKADEET